MQTILSIPGIHCDGCAALVKDVSTEFPAIKNVAVDLTTKQVTLEHDEGFDLEAWKTEIESLDPKYKVELISKAEPKP